MDQPVLKIGCEINNHRFQEKSHFYPVRVNIFFYIDQNHKSHPFFDCYCSFFSQKMVCCMLPPINCSFRIPYKLFSKEKCWKRTQLLFLLLILSLFEQRQLRYSRNFLWVKKLKSFQVQVLAFFFTGEIQ